MKFLVNELPFYGDSCPFREICYGADNDMVCPRHWDKYKVTSDDREHECVWLKEVKLGFYY